MTKKRTSKIKFSKKPLHNKKELHPLAYLSERYSFWVATFSILSFIVGNMVGTHGWYTVWKSVLGQTSESLIVYTGTVTPIDKVPNYVAWARLGGNPHDHTFRQVPRSVLIDLPPYDASTQARHMEVSPYGQIYSVGHAGSYTTGGDGDGYHPGVDIRVPIGTPIRSVANGIVEFAGDKGGYGNAIVVKHPNVPDPSNPAKTTTLYSTYAHLSGIHVREGDTVLIGSKIGVSGNTGKSTGPHLHFQMDRQTAPWHPYWPEGNNQALVYKHTVHSMHYAQANYQPAVLIASADPEVTQRVLTPKERRAQRIANRKSSRTRVAVRTSAPVTNTRTAKIAETANASRRSLSRNEIRNARIKARLANKRYSRQPTPKTNPVIVSKKEVATASAELPVFQQSDFASVRIEHDGSFNRAWEEITLSFYDTNGNRVSSPDIKKDIYLRTAFGKAEFEPAIISSEHVNSNGEVVIKMLPRGKQTVVIEVKPQGNLSKPMKYN